MNATDFIAEVWQRCRLNPSLKPPTGFKTLIRDTEKDNIAFNLNPYFFLSLLRTSTLLRGQAGFSPGRPRRPLPEGGAVVLGRLALFLLLFCRAQHPHLDEKKKPLIPLSLLHAAY